MHAQKTQADIDVALFENWLVYQIILRVFRKLESDSEQFLVGEN